jgi:hypothetical protein
MSSKSFILFPGSGPWRVASAGAPSVPVVFTEVPVPPGATDAQAAGAISESLKLAGYRGGDSVLLAVPASWCLCATIKVGGLPARARRQAMLYRMEEKLPLPAEDVVADFIAGADGAGAGDALGVCVQTRRLAPVVDALEAAGVDVQSISPASLLAVQGWLGAVADEEQTRHVKSPPADLVLWPGDDVGTLELFAVADGRPTAWYVLPDDPKDVALHLGMIAPMRDPTHRARLVASGVRPEVLRVLAAAPGIEVLEEVAPRPPHVHAASAARAALAGRAEPWVELRRGAMAANGAFRRARAPLTAAAFAAVVFLVTAAGALLWRAGQYAAVAGRNEGLQRDLFRQAFPGRAAPPDVRSRLAREEQGLRALRGPAAGPSSSSPASPPPQEQGLVALRDLINALPRDRRYRVLEVRLDGRKFSIDGQAKSHGDADAIAAALRAKVPADVDPPRTEQLDETVTTISFNIAGTLGAAGPVGKVRGGGEAAR